MATTPTSVEVYISTGFAQAVSIRMEASSVRTSETLTTTRWCDVSDPESCSSASMVRTVG